MIKKNMYIIVAMCLAMGIGSISTGCSNNGNVKKNEQAVNLPKEDEKTLEDSNESKKNEEISEEGPREKSKWFVFPDSSKKHLVNSDMKGLTLWELQIGRNEIFARHGYEFSQKEFSDYFKKMPWYTPSSSFSYDNLNVYEVANAELIREFEDKFESGDEEPVATESSDDRGEHVVKEENNSVPGRYPESSIKKLTEYDLHYYSTFNLDILRNEIFARKGYSFNQKYFKDYFNSKEWYNAEEDFSYDSLTEIESANIELLDRFHKQLFYNKTSKELQDGIYNGEVIKLQDNTLRFRVFPKYYLIEENLASVDFNIDDYIEKNFEIIVDDNGNLKKVHIKDIIDSNVSDYEFFRAGLIDLTSSGKREFGYYVNKFYSSPTELLLSDDFIGKIEDSFYQKVLGGELFDAEAFARSLNDNVLTNQSIKTFEATITVKNSEIVKIYR